MPRRNRNSDREPLNRDRLIDDAAALARELIPRDLVWVTGEVQFPARLSTQGGDS